MNRLELTILPIPSLAQLVGHLLEFQPDTVSGPVNKIT